MSKFISSFNVSDDEVITCIICEASDYDDALHAIEDNFPNASCINIDRFNSHTKKTYQVEFGGFKLIYANE